MIDSAASALAPALFDLRTRAAYAQGHHAEASHLPLAELVLRRHELPPPGRQLQLCHDDAAALAVAAAQLRDWGYSIAGCVQVDAALLRQWQQHGVLRQGQDSCEHWQPSSSLLLALTDLLPADWPALAPAGGRALDLACGSGRDALYLATRGFAVSAVDNKADALQRLAASAEARGLSIRTFCFDLEADDARSGDDGERHIGYCTDNSQHPQHPQHHHQQQSPFLSAPFALINVARYLHRPLLARLRGWLAPGGLLVYETFLQGAERFGGPRRPAFLLAPGELAQVYADWQIMLDRAVTLADGRPVQQFIARCPAR